MSESGPYRQAMGITPSVESDETWLLRFKPGLLGRPGFLHGGAIGGFLAETCDSTAEQEGGAHDAATTTMSFLRGGRERDTHARAYVRARTSRFLVIEASAWQESPDKPIATMTRTYLRR
jgi:acyl-coenzyme A thioesterase PaaI-like protein